MHLEVLVSMIYHSFTQGSNELVNNCVHKTSPVINQDLISSYHPARFGRFKASIEGALLVISHYHHIAKLITSTSNSNLVGCANRSLFVNTKFSIYSLIVSKCKRFTIILTVCSLKIHVRNRLH